MKKKHYLCTRKAPVAELVDASDLGSGVSRRAGSSPVRRTPLTTKISVKITKFESNQREKDKKMQIF